MSAVVPIATRELKDLWFAGRGLVLLLAFTVLLGVTTYLVATNQALNFLEQRESVNLTLQVAVAVGGLLVLLTAADAISGERERGTLESLLLAPGSRRAIVLGKALSALSLWLACFVATALYIHALGSAVGAAWSALVAGLAVGSMLAAFLAGLGVLVSMFAGSNRLSLSVSLFVLLALYAPTQMPTSTQFGWLGDALTHVDPFTAGLQVLSNVVVGGQALGDQGSWLAAPALATVAVWAAVVALAGRLRLDGGGRG